MLSSSLSGRLLAALLCSACLHVPVLAQPASPQPASSAPAAPSGPTTPAPAAARPVLGVDELVELALRHNPGLRAAQQSRDAATAGVTSARTLPNPRIDALAGSNRARLPGITGGGVTGWGVSQLVENPALREARVRAAQSGLGATAWQVAQAANELAAQVRLTAFELVLREEEAASAADALALLEQIRERVKLRVDSGEAPRFDVIKADAEVINARQKFAAAQVQVEQAKLAIDRLAAGQLPPGWRVAAVLDDVGAPPPVAQLLAELPQRNPELQGLRSELARRQASLEEVRASRFRGVELRVGQTRDPEVRQSIVGAAIELPLFDRRVGPTAQAAAELERARTLLEGRQVELAQQLQSAAKQIELAQSRVDALGRGAVPEAEAVLRIAQAAYRFGERGILDLLDAQRLLRSVRSDLIEARFQLQAARIALEQLAGRYTPPSFLPAVQP
jgi:cobalt-zinc-cadmium efflux system outer membrane protein